jgi:hypothetical protein
MEVHTYNPSYMEGGNGRIMVQGQPGQKRLQEPVLQNKLAMLTHASNPNYAGNRGLPRPALGKSMRP